MRSMPRGYAKALAFSIGPLKMKVPYDLVCFSSITVKNSQVCLLIFAKLINFSCQVSSAALLRTISLLSGDIIYGILQNSPLLVSKVYFARGFFEEF